MSKSCNIPSAKNLSVHDCVKLRALAFREYKTYAKDADLHRDDFYELLAEAKAEEGDITKCNALKQLRLNEESRTTHRRIKVTTKNMMGAPYQMEIAYKGGTILSSDQAQLEDALMKENESKYRLAYSSSFMHPPLFSDFG